ncbi:MAG: hypothetical protein QGG73_03665 [Candidatus Hydrogenedentes bacterium]|jgi:NAD+ kinase|nr:hypothetical protein [Candidatus Hydrogenedentota bacterium]
MKVILFGEHAEELGGDLRAHKNLDRCESEPEAVVCFGGDGTLLSAELKWPYIPKVPIRNSEVGKRMMNHPPGEIIRNLAEGTLMPSKHMKVECSVRPSQGEVFLAPLSALNEFNVRLGAGNSALRYRIWIDNHPIEEGVEIIGDGFIVSTPFGSTAYYRQITRGIFHAGLGIAFKYTSELVNHIVTLETSVIRAKITRGLARLGYDSAAEEVPLATGDELVIKRDPRPATLLTINKLHRPSDEL